VLTIPEQFLAAARSAAALLAQPAVAAAWDQPSALPDFAVSGLAGHLARQVVWVPRLLAVPAPDQPPISLAAHYARAGWAGTGPGSAANTGIRADGEAEAADGAGALAARVADAVTALAAVLPAGPPGRLVHLPWGPWSLTLDDFLVTRLMELAVHADDLAVSTGLATPELPADVTATVLGLLVTLAARRHGPVAVLRALSRAERAPVTIAAF
jgi:Mycothiol maleylpyruvate isomerase N-terminal domain